MLETNDNIWWGLKFIQRSPERFTSLQLLWKRIKGESFFKREYTNIKENLMESLDQGSQKVLQWQSSVDISMTATSGKRYLM